MNNQKRSRQPANANGVGSSDVLGISRHRKLNKTERKMTLGEKLAESCCESVAKKLIANPTLKNLPTLESSLPKSSPANQKSKIQTRRAVMPNDQELSHAAGDFRQPETRSANCQA